MDLNKTRRRLRARGGTRKKIVGGAVRVNGDAAGAILAPIYEALPKSQATSQHNLTYGEIEWPTLKTILDHVEKQPWSTVPGSRGKFYDLGCGRGRAVLYMGMAGPFDLSVGVEVLPERVRLAQQALNQLKQSIPSAGAKIRFYETSFLNPSLKYKDARAVFLSNLCFDDETQASLFRKLSAEMPKGSLVFCSRLPTDLGAFEKIAHMTVKMSWTESSDFNILKHL